MARQPWVKYWYADWTGDMTLQRCTLQARGAWHETLCFFWHDGIYEFGAETEEWGRLWRCSTKTAEEVITELRARGVCDVTARDDGSVTLLSRRLQREHKRLEGTRLRVQKHRDKKAGNETVTPEGEESETEVSRSTRASARARTQKPRGPEAQKPRGPEAQKPRGPEANTTPPAPKGAKKFPDWFEILWKAYPGKDKTPTWKRCEKLAKNGASPQDMIAAATHYRDDPSRKPDYTKHGATFYGPQEPWKDYVQGLPGGETKPPTKPGAYDQELGRW